MAEQSKIEWTDHTFNPWEGCQKVAPECDNCYAEARDNRFTGGKHWGPKAPRRRTSAANWAKPRKWNREAKDNALRGLPRPRVFCASLADVFDNAVDPAWREDLWALIRECDNLDWQLLTKRPQNIAKMLPADWGNGWPHVWLGTSAGSQKTADQNIPALLSVPAAVRFVSAEPLLGPLDLTRWIGTQPFIPGASTYEDQDGHERQDIGGIILDGLSWVICGGESGSNARPMHPDWARSLRDQCQASGVAFFFKQWGEWGQVKTLPSQDGDETAWPNGTFGVGGANDKGGPGSTVRKVGKKAAGRMLDGREWNEFPQSRKGTS